MSKSAKRGQRCRCSDKDKKPKGAFDGASKTPSRKPETNPVKALMETRSKKPDQNGLPPPGAA